MEPIEVGRFPIYGDVDIEIVVSVLLPRLGLKTVALDGSLVPALPVAIEVTTEPPDEPLILHVNDSVRLSTLLTDAIPIVADHDGGVVW